MDVLLEVFVEPFAELLFELLGVVFLGWIDFRSDSDQPWADREKGNLYGIAGKSYDVDSGEPE